MDALVLINALATLVIFTAVSWLVLSPAVRDGIVIKIGLVLVALSELGVAMLLVGDGWYLPRPLLLCLAGIHVGAAVVALGYLLRQVRTRHPVRRSTDWATLDIEARLHDGMAGARSSPAKH